MFGNFLTEINNKSVLGNNTALLFSFTDSIGNPIGSYYICQQFIEGEWPVLDWYQFQHYFLVLMFINFIIPVNLVFFENLSNFQSYGSYFSHYLTYDLCTA